MSRRNGKSGSVPTPTLLQLRKTRIRSWCLGESCMYRGALLSNRLTRVIV